jgi:hypothetical protein
VFVYFLEQRTQQHTFYFIIIIILQDMPRRGRKPRLDPSMIDHIKMTGDENVSVVNRITGKKVGLFYKNF